jgi:ABC-2 type transport system permease protein
MRLFLATLAKLARRPATLLTFGVLAAFLVLILLAVSTGPPPDGQNGGGPDFDPLELVTFPGAYRTVLGFVLGLGGLFAVIFGAAIAGSEWSWGTFKSVVARGESRTVYMLATFGAVGVVLVVGLVVTFVIGVVAAMAGATIAGVPLDGMGDAEAIGELPVQFARGGFGLVTQGAIGFTVATLARSQLAGIGFGIGIYFVGTFATLFLPDYVKYLPFQLAGDAIGSTGGFGGGGGALSPGFEPEMALLLLGVWLVGSLVVSAGFSERAEVLG